MNHNYKKIFATTDRMPYLFPRNSTTTTTIIFVPSQELYKIHQIRTNIKTNMEYQSQSSNIK